MSKICLDACQAKAENAEKFFSAKTQRIACHKVGFRATLSPSAKPP
jgi:hypothetical protein